MMEMQMMQMSGDGERSSEHKLNKENSGNDPCASSENVQAKAVDVVIATAAGSSDSSELKKVQEEIHAKCWLAYKVLLGLGVFVLATILLEFAFLYLYGPLEVCQTKSCRTAKLFTKAMDDTVDPCDDFFKFVCGNLKAYSEHVTYDYLALARSRQILNIAELISEISPDEPDFLLQMKRMQDSCLALSVESNKTTSLKPMADLISDLIPNSSPRNKSLAQTMGTIHRNIGEDFIFSLFVNYNYTGKNESQAQPKTLITLWDSDSLFQNDSFEDKDGKMAHDYTDLIKSATDVIYEKLGSEMLIAKHISQNVGKIVELERNLALAQSTLEVKNETKIFNVEELNILFNNRFNWSEYLSVVLEGILPINETTSILVKNVDYLIKVRDLLTNEDPYLTEMYLAWKLIYSFGPALANDFKELFKKFDNLEGVKESSAFRDLNNDCRQLWSELSSSLSFASIHKYAIKYISPEIVDETNEIAKYVKAAFQPILENLEWMDIETKRTALLKLSNLSSYIGIPEWFKDSRNLERYFQGLQFGDSYFQNQLILAKWETQNLLNGSIAEIIKELHWPLGNLKSASPIGYIPYYDPTSNAYVIPFGYLQHPFVGLGVRAADFGAIGFTIGHEIAHGFAYTGADYDEKGDHNPWWSAHTLATSSEKMQCLENQYNNYELPGVSQTLGLNTMLNRLNGTKTLAENAADNGALLAAFMAYRSYMGKHESAEQRLPGKLGKYTSEQKIFFLAFAHSWCVHQSPNATINEPELDRHSPNHLRILGTLSNSEEFSKA